MPYHLGDRGISTFWMNLLPPSSSFYPEDTDLSSTFVTTIKLSYNDKGLCGTSSVVSNILWFQLIPHTAYWSFRMALVYNNTNYSVPFMMLY